jgi:hypothetical protein
MVRLAAEQAGARRPNPCLESVRLERWREGAAVQAMHVGPYSEEPRTVALIEAFMTATGHRPTGRHHEIYLGDPRRAKAENLRTILRQPVAGL